MDRQRDPSDDIISDPGPQDSDRLREDQGLVSPPSSPKGNPHASSDSIVQAPLVRINSSDPLAMFYAQAKAERDVAVSAFMSIQ